MRNRICCLIVFLVFLSQSRTANGSRPEVVLKEFDYSELALLQIKKGVGGKFIACFYGRKKGSSNGSYVWIAEKSEISTRNAFVLHIRPDHVEIDETIGINGVDWVSVSFKWPVARDPDNAKLRSECNKMQS